MHDSVVKRLELFNFTFFEGDTEELRRYHLVAWDVVKRPIATGGLGIRSLPVLKKALLAKWLWKFMSCGAGLWREVVICKYGFDGMGWKSARIS